MARKACDKHGSCIPIAITLDVMMPDIDGWTVLAAIKGDPDLADIPVILVTIVDEKQRGYTLGAADYLVKPVDRERLAAYCAKSVRPRRPPRTPGRRRRPGTARNASRRWKRTAGT